ncbi:MAG: putative phosphodiesterase, partial [Natronomonas sp.]
KTVTGAGPALLNPGSHATPRGGRPGYATLTPTADGLSGTLREPDGTVVDRLGV